MFLANFASALLFVGTMILGFGSLFGFVIFLTNAVDQRQTSEYRWINFALAGLMVLSLCLVAATLMTYGSPDTWMRTMFNDR